MSRVLYYRVNSDGTINTNYDMGSVSSLPEKYCYDIDSKINFGGRCLSEYEVQIHTSKTGTTVYETKKVIDSRYDTDSYNSYYANEWYNMAEISQSNDPETAGAIWYQQVFFPVETVTADQFKFFITLYVKDIRGTFYPILTENGFNNFTVLRTADLQDYYDSDGLIYNTNDKIVNHNYEVSGLFGGNLYSKKIYLNWEYWWTRCRDNFQIPGYLANGESLYVSLYTSYTGDFLAYTYDDGVFKKRNGTIYRTIIPVSNKAFLGKCVRNYTIPSYSISYPAFTNSKYAKVSLPSVLNTYKSELYQSTDNGSNWSLVETKTSANSITTNSSWTITLNDGTKTTATFACAPPVPAWTKTVSSNTLSTKYKAIYYASSSNKLEKVGTSNMEILDLTMPSNPVISNYSDFNNRTPETFSIAKTTITDLTRLSFTEYFYKTSLPKTTQQGQAGVTSYQVQALDDNNSLTTNFGNYFEIPNDSYQYRIAPKLDGSVNYKSSTNNTYEIFKYTKATSKIDMTRSIEMGTVQPKKIKILVNPIKTTFPAGSTVTFYVANNGNDENIIWEELPYDCIGSASEPKVNELEFSNNTKTADTWKVMLRIVADKGTATTDFYLKTVTVVINGGSDATQNAYSVLNHVVLDENATSVQIDVPEGYNRYKLIGNIINTNKSGNPYIRVNGLSSGYDTIITYIASGTLTDTTSTTSAGFSAYTNSGKCPMFECDLFNYNTTWYISCHGDADLGDSKSHSMITLANGLQNITLTCSSNSYPMQAGTEFTLMGVET